MEEPFGSCMDEEIMMALYEIAEERAKKQGIDITQVKMSDEELLERIKERRLR